MIFLNFESLYLYDYWFDFKKFTHKTYLETEIRRFSIVSILKNQNKSIFESILLEEISDFSKSGLAPPHFQCVEFCSVNIMPNHLHHQFRHKKQILFLPLLFVKLHLSSEIFHFEREIQPSQQALGLEHWSSALPLGPVFSELRWSQTKSKGKKKIYFLCLN